MHSRSDGKVIGPPDDTDAQLGLCTDHTGDPTAGILGVGHDFHSVSAVQERLQYMVMKHSLITTVTFLVKQFRKFRSEGYSKFAICSAMVAVGTFSLSYKIT